MVTSSTLRIRGYGFLTREQQQEVQKALRRHQVAFRLAGRDADQEINLLKISATGVIPAVIKQILRAFDLELGF